MIEQGSQEWLQQRLGKVTASRIKDVMTTIKSGESAARRNYRAQLVAERLTNIAQDSYSNSAMQWGIDNEPIARAMYEIKTGLDVQIAPFVDHPSIAMTGASPDGFVGDGLVEIKCPNTATHIDYVLAGDAPSEYKLQMLWQMECTGKEWCDFVSYDPRMPQELQLFIVRYIRDDKKLNEVRDEVAKFIISIDSMVKELKRMKDAKSKEV